jgi:hypothetical protein
MWYTKQLIFHGAVVLLIGLLCGAPLGSAVVRAKSEEIVRGWRVAHSSLVMGGILLLAVAGIAERLRRGAFAQHLLVWPLVISSYGFAVVLPFALWSWLFFGWRQGSLALAEVVRRLEA